MSVEVRMMSVKDMGLEDLTAELKRLEEERHYCDSGDFWVTTFSLAENVRLADFVRKQIENKLDELSHQIIIARRLGYNI